jgi:hypothetical protein
MAPTAIVWLWVDLRLFHLHEYDYGLGHYIASRDDKWREQ